MQGGDKSFLHSSSLGEKSYVNQSPMIRSIAFTPRPTCNLLTHPRTHTPPRVHRRVWHKNGRLVDQDYCSLAIRPCAVPSFCSGRQPVVVPPLVLERSKHDIGQLRPFWWFLQPCGLPLHTCDKSDLPVSEQKPRHLVCVSDAGQRRVGERRFPMSTSAIWPRGNMHGFTCSLLNSIG
ncbi:hypothetical protein BT67DRAFT_124305 [Trichocladium antarcticum]|uniref:Uncharacterized protein n=1 Tax=Trichocladium antarcticum TaxID=1450529 RepID=A0AAN6US04_9PEZI|nr:hypothetical protein BT67DRAFT_124305 [Trichocladium antarcticum]